MEQGYACGKNIQWRKLRRIAMATTHYLMTAEQRLEMIKYSKIHGVEKACEKYSCTQATIYRWRRKYDGTLKSLEDKSSRPNNPHPSEHSKEEVDNIREVLSKNPYISHKELYEILKNEYGYNRHIGGLYNYLRRHRMIPEPKQKNEYATMFDEKAVRRLNNKFIYDNKDKLPLYVIELSDLDVYIASNASNYPCKLCVYYSVALVFNTLNEAEKFVKSIKNTSKFQLNIRELKERK